MFGGYRDMVNIDISSVAIEQMREKHADMPMEWHVTGAAEDTRELHELGRGMKGRASKTADSESARGDRLLDSKCTLPGIPSRCIPWVSRNDMRAHLRRLR